MYAELEAVQGLDGLRAAEVPVDRRVHHLLVVYEILQGLRESRQDLDATFFTRVSAFAAKCR